MVFKADLCSLPVAPEKRGMDRDYLPDTHRVHPPIYASRPEFLTESPLQNRNHPLTIDGKELFREARNVPSARGVFSTS